MAQPAHQRGQRTAAGQRGRVLRQTIFAYPSGGGSYVVASDNLGRLLSPQVIGPASARAGPALTGRQDDRGRIALPSAELAQHLPAGTIREVDAPY
jgi:hypothetical protein